MDRVAQLVEHPIDVSIDNGGEAVGSTPTVVNSFLLGCIGGPDIPGAVVAPATTWLNWQSAPLKKYCEYGGEAVGSTPTVVAILFSSRPHQPVAPPRCSGHNQARRRGVQNPAHGKGSHRQPHHGWRRTCDHPAAHKPYSGGEGVRAGSGGVGGVGGVGEGGRAGRPGRPGRPPLGHAK
jgi:hypothetical protein